MSVSGAQRRAWQNSHEGITPIRNAARYKGGPFAQWHHAELGNPHPGRDCPAYDTDLVDWLFEWDPVTQSFEPSAPLILWEECLIGTDVRRKGKQLRAADIHAKRLGIPGRLVQTDPEASAFLVSDLVGGEVKRYSRQEMVDLIDRLRRGAD